MIKNPIDLRTIALNIQGGSYASLDEMVRDLNLLVHNAKAFNEPGSIIYRVSIHASVYHTLVLTTVMCVCLSVCVCVCVYARMRWLVCWSQLLGMA